MNAYRLWPLLVVFLVACGGPDDAESDRPRVEPELLVDGRALMQPEPVGELPRLERFPGRLSAAGDVEDVWERPALVTARALDEESTRRLLDRLEPLPVDPDDERQFALRPDSRPPPRTGEIVVGQFPAEHELALPQTRLPEGPLQVLRFAPEGEVPIAGQVSVTFDRPLVAVGAHDELSEVRPVRMSPEVPGRWRWAGTRTLLFEPDAARLPMATRYELELDEGLAALDDARLEQAVRWTFSTPPARLVDSSPSGQGVRLEPVIVLVFDQRIRLDELEPFLELRDHQGDRLAWRAASDEELAADEQAARLTERLEPGRWVALRAESRLEPATTIEIIVRAGAPSAEGPVVTELDQRRSFSTYGAFVVRRQRCGWERVCSPVDALVLELSNPLAESQPLEELIEVAPAIPGMVLEAGHGEIRIQGLKQGQARYQVSLSEQLEDAFGQSLSGIRSFAFEVGSLPPAMWMGHDRLITTDPAGDPVLDLFTTNHASIELTVHRVEVDDWPAYLTAVHGRRPPDASPGLPGELLFEGSLAIEPRRDEPVRTTLDLGQWLEDGQRGHLIVQVEAGAVLDGVQLPRFYSPRRQVSWVQATGLGLDASADARALSVWVSRLADGEPLADVEVGIGGTTLEAKSDADGMVSIELPERERQSDQPGWIIARLGDDSALLPDSSYWLSRSSWVRGNEPDSLIWQVFDDRKLYRPGEQVHLKGWVRRLERHPAGGLALPPESRALQWQVSDSRGNTLAEGRGELSGLGGFDLAFELPDTPNLGQASVQISLDAGERLGNTRHTHQFRIEEFRTPEFEVRTEVAAGPFVGETPLRVDVLAAYYAGGALSAAPVRWDVRAEPGYYRPPGHDRWAFGFEPTWWMPWAPESRNGSSTASFEGVTDGLGRHGLDIELDFSDQPRPLALNASATVTDVNRQAWSASTDLLVHPGEAYVGLRTEAYFTELGADLELDLLTVDIDGEPLAGRPVLVEAEALGFGWRTAATREGDGRVQRCRVESDREGLARCRFTAATPGQLRITATTLDSQGRANASRILRWVGGGRMPAAERVEIESVLLIPDQEKHRPGDVARLLVQAPFEDAEGLLSLRRHGLAEQRRFRIDGGSTTLEIPLKREWMPNIEAHVTLIGAAERAEDRELPPRPAIAVGAHAFQISTAERALAVEVEPGEAALAPGGSTEIELRVLDADGQPVADAEIALIVVDEAVLGLTGYRLTDPLQIFYPDRPAEVRDSHLRPSVRLRAPEDLAELDAALKHELGAAPPQVMHDSMQMERAMVTGSRIADMDESAEPIDIREDFNPLAAFVPALITDAEGRVRTRLTLPDNLTRYRISAVAVSGASHYGLGESSLTARLPLMIRPSPPRFLNFGDRFEFPVVLQNQTDRSLEVDVALAVANLGLTGPQGLRLDVPAGDRVEVRFPAEARSAGTARYQLAVAAADFADAARGQLPVWTPATSEAFATYGTLDEGSLRQPVQTPAEVWPQFGQLEITTSSTAVQSLTDAFLYLHRYPFACSEQLASRMLATAALRDVLEAFEVADMPSPDEIDRSMARDLEALASIQNTDGGFGLWRRGEESWPFATVHVAHALVRARAKGYSVDERLYERSLAHLVQIESHIPAYYGPWARRHILAYSLHVRSLVGDHDRPRARALLAEVDDLSDFSFEALGWLLMVLSGDPDSRQQLADIHRLLNNRVVETAAGATFATGWRDGAHLIMHSSRRADGVLLEALIHDQPQSDLVVKLVRSLQGHRSRGRWGNTQENVFVLLALDRYFQIYETETPDFVARTWLGEDFAGEHAFRGRTTEQHQLDIPMQWLVDGGPDHELVLDKDGAGRLYYRIGLRYAPRSLDLAAASHGFEVERRYRAVDDEQDVRQLEDGSWEIRAGARVRIELEMVAPARRYHVALIDPLPAGLEPINPALATSAPAPVNLDPGRPEARSGWWWGPWYRHQNLRDERAEAFTELLPGGVYQYAYLARATTPGDFVVPPARAEEMYAPETFGRSASTRVRVIEWAD